MNISCRSCRFYHRSQGDGYSECRRYSPSPRLTYEGRHDEMGGAGVWPIVHGADWCGEYETSVNTHGTSTNRLQGVSQ